MKTFYFLLLISLLCISESSAQLVQPNRTQVVRAERDNIFDNSETEDRSTETEDSSEEFTAAEQVVKEITEKLCSAVKESDIKSYLDCLSEEKREKDKMKIVKQFMAQNNPNLDVLKTFILDESKDQIDFIAKYCSNGEWIHLSEVTLIKENGKFVVSKERVMETTSNSPAGFVERNAHLKGLDPNVPIKPCHMGANCKFANEAGHRLAEQEKRAKVAPFQPQVDVKRIPDPVFNPNGNNWFVDQEGGIREVHQNGWVSVPKNGPQYVDLKQLKKYFPDRYSGCKDGNCSR
jgi:hypothetical protein